MAQQPSRLDRLPTRSNFSLHSLFKSAKSDAKSPVSPFRSRPSLVSLDNSQTDDPPLVSQDDLPKDYLTGYKLVLVFIGLLLGNFIVSLDTTIVATATPAIVAQFKSQDQIGWYASAFYIPFAVFQSSWGKAYNFLSPKWVILLAILVFEIGSLVCGLATNSIMLILGRAVAGLGGGGIIGGVYIIYAQIAPPKTASMLVATSGAAYGIASAAGPLLGGVFTTTVTWRWAFYINLPVGAVTVFTLLFFFRVPSHIRPPPITFWSFIYQLDLLGAAFMLGSLICFTLAMQWGGLDKPWSSPDVIGTLVGFVVLLAAFGINAHIMGDDAMIVGYALRRRMVIVGGSIIFVLVGILNVLLFSLPQYFQIIQNSSALVSGLKNLPFIVLVSVAGMAAGLVFSQYGFYMVILAVGTTLITVGSGLIYTLDQSSPLGPIEGYQAIVGTGVGMIIQVPILVAQAQCTGSDIAAVSSAILFFQLVPGALWVAASQAILNNLFLNTLASRDPTIEGRAVLDLGAEGLRAAFSGGQLADILASYMDGLKSSWLMALAMSGLAFLLSFTGEWKNIRPMPGMVAAPV